MANFTGDLHINEIFYSAHCFADFNSCGYSSLEDYLCSKNSVEILSFECVDEKKPYAYIYYKRMVKDLEQKGYDVYTFLWRSMSNLYIGVPKILETEVMWSNKKGDYVKLSSK